MIWLHALTVALPFMFVIWIMSLIAKDVSIVDRFWGMVFIVLALANWLLVEHLSVRGILVTILVTIWGLRLSIFIHFRNKGHGEDRRYAKMRALRPETFWIYSLVWVFLTQGFLASIIALPVLYVQTNTLNPVVTVFDAVGTGIFLFGFFFETIADYQMSKFKQNPKNRGNVMRTGLWGLSRHPNYFGESLVWWGFFVIALSEPGGLVTVVGPLTITYFIIKVTGVNLLEADLRTRSPDYVAYIRDVPSFIPKFRR